MLYRLNDDGDVIQVCYSNQTRDSFMSLQLEDVEPMIKALRLFDDLMYDEANLFRIKLSAGQ